MKRNLLSAFVLFTLIISTNMAQKKGKSDEQVLQSTGSSFTDLRDNKTYLTVEIEGKTWFAQNLDFEIQGSYYYNDNARNTTFFGRLYTWDAAIKACPTDWHLSTDGDWMALERALGMPTQLLDESEFRGTDQADKLMVKGSANFNLTMGGYRNHDGIFEGMDEMASYWTATNMGKFDAWGRGFEKDNSQIAKRTFGKSFGFSLRCVKN